MHTEHTFSKGIMYPYLTQKFGLSGWIVYTPITLTDNPDFNRKPHVDLKQRKRPMRIVGREGQLLENKGINSAKEDWYFYWHKAVYDENGHFSLEFKSALKIGLSKEKLRGYIFRDPDLHFSATEVVRVGSGEKYQFDAAYLDTNYVVDDGQIKMVIRIGEINPVLNELLEKRQNRSWAFITAYNPYSEPTSDEDNQELQERLIRELQRKHLQFLNGYGQSASGDWQIEQSVLIFDIDRETAAELGNNYRQNAIVFGQIDKQPELVWC